MANQNVNDGFVNRSTNGAPAVNRLLATLPKSEYNRLLPKLKRVTLALGQPLYEAGGVIKYVYFPNDSIISLISELTEKSLLEVGMWEMKVWRALPSSWVSLLRQHVLWFKAQEQQ